MTSRFIKTIRNVQPALLLAAALVYGCLDRRWPVAVGVFILLEIGFVLGGLWRGRHQDRHRQNVRFLARGVVAPLTPPCAPPGTKPRRSHLRLV